MSASEHLHPKLFHGTNAWLKPGEIIKPGVRDAYYGPGSRLAFDNPDSEHVGVGAYASLYEHDAAYFTDNAQKNAEKHNMETQGFHQRELFSPVYEVEHVSEHSDPTGAIARSNPDFRRDTQGFRVKGIAQLVPTMY